MKKTDCFSSILNEFELEPFKQYCSDMIEQIDDLYFNIPASTSYKYHNKTQCGIGGQTYHVIFVASVMNYLLGLDYMRNKFTSMEQRDCLRIAAILHDSQKTDGGQYTVHEHPLLAKEWIIKTKVEHDIDQKYKNYIGNLVASHSGQWTTGRKSTDEELPAPQNDAEFLVHLCDYLASRKDIDMLYSDDIKDAVMCCADTSPDTYVLSFGKYKGMTLSEIAEENPSYIKWMKENIDREPENTLLKNL